MVGGARQAEQVWIDRAARTRRLGNNTARNVLDLINYRPNTLSSRSTAPKNASATDRMLRKIPRFRSHAGDESVEGLISAVTPRTATWGRSASQVRSMSRATSASFACRPTADQISMRAVVVEPGDVGGTSSV